MEDASQPSPLSRRDAWSVGAVSVAGGVAAGLSGASPTGRGATDVLVTFTLGAFVTWAGATAPWWLIIAAGAASMAGVAASPWLIAGGMAVAIGGALWWLSDASSRDPDHDWCWLRSVASGLIVLALLHVSVNPFFGASALLAGGVIVVYVVLALRGRARPPRRRAFWTVIGIAGGVTLISALFAYAAAGERDTLTAGFDHMQDGLDLLGAGETNGAADMLQLAAAEIDEANDGMDTWWLRPVALVPVLAQHRSTLARTLGAAAESARSAARALSVTELDELRINAGSIDVGALARVADPLADLDSAMRDLAAVLDSVDSPWLVNPLRDELSDARADLDPALVRSAASAAAARVGPAMLGIDGPRRYLVVFLSPARATALGGAIIDFAELTVTDGDIEQTGFGRADDVGGSWSTLTSTPDAPSAAAEIARTYAAAGFGSVDGVFMLDPTGLASLLDVAGAVTIEGVAEPITAESLEHFLLVDQYRLTDETRQDVFEAVTSLALQQFLAASLPAPQDLAHRMGPAATEGHLTAWARRPEEQRMLVLVGMAGQLPDVAGGDGLAVTNENMLGNDIDAFLERAVAYTATFDAKTGVVRGEATVTLTNRAPRAGYPKSVIGNIAGLAVGTNRTRLTLYTPLTATGAAVDGREVDVADGDTLGWSTVSLIVDLPPGDTVTVTVSVEGVIASDGYTFVWRPQPLARPATLTLDVSDLTGRPVAGFDGVLDRTSVIDTNAVSAFR